jgi:hypothetical protein
VRLTGWWWAWPSRPLRRFPFLQSKDWIGNWCWNGYALPRDEAKKLLRHLRESGRWRCTHGPTRWYDWFNMERS